jgi:CubicO group peptidase (beta-lactamase class C family)
LPERNVRHYAALIGDRVEGIRLLPPERVRIATTPQTDAQDVVLNAAHRKALGYLLGGAAAPDPAMGTRASAFGHPGYGGSQGFADPEAGLAVGLTRTTLCGGGSLHLGIVRRVRDGLGVPY